MRNLERVDVNGQLVEVAELRVRDVRELMQIQQQKLDSTIVQRCVSADLSQFNADEFALIDQAFIRVNAAFYQPGDTRSQAGAQASSQAGKNAADQLDQACCVLIERGHVGVCDYGWGFFLTCIKVLAK